MIKAEHTQPVPGVLNRLSVKDTLELIHTKHPNVKWMWSVRDDDNSKIGIEMTIGYPGKYTSATMPCEMSQDEQLQCVALHECMFDALMSPSKKVEDLHNILWEL